MSGRKRPTTEIARAATARELAELNRKRRARESFPVTESTGDVRRLLDLALGDLDGIDLHDPFRCAIVRVVAALDRILRRADKLDREISGLPIAVMGHAAVDAFARFAIGVDAAPARPAKRKART
jgi:hypothetical protein